MPTPRLPVADPDEVTPDVREVFDNFMKVRGNIPNMFRTLAARPEIMKIEIAAHNDHEVEQILWENGARLLGLIG